MNSIRLRELQRGDFRNPVQFLVSLRALEPGVTNSNLDEPIKQLRTNSLNEWREVREAALFCCGMAQRIGRPVYLRRGESQDYDFVAAWDIGDEWHFAPVR